ncbi:hypothetical protein D9N00_19200 [Pseudomonas syringae pv. actinidiae]|nr:hypothetical protein D9N00_19200 [Pseudomonas syringae pv. actinidiae]
MHAFIWQRAHHVDAVAYQYLVELAHIEFQVGASPGWRESAKWGIGVLLHEAGPKKDSEDGSVGGYQNFMWLSGLSFWACFLRIVVRLHQSRRFA